MLKVGVIGSGFGLYGLLPAFNSVKNCKVVCICGKKTDRLVEYCNKIGLEKIYLDWKSMLKNEDLDAVALAVTPNIQYKIAKVAIKKNISIFAEKPLSLNYKQSAELLKLAKKYKVNHAVDFIFPEIKEWQEVKKNIEKKEFGKLKHMSVDWQFLSYDIKNKISSWKTDSKEGGGALSFYFSHTLNYLEYYAGEISKIKSLFSYSSENLRGAEVGVDLIIKFKNGVTANANIYTGDKGLKKHQLTFIFEKATVVLENTENVVDGFKLAVYKENGCKKILIKHRLRFKAGEDERVKVVRVIADRFVKDCIGGSLTSPSFVDGVRVQKLIEIIKQNKI